MALALKLYPTQDINTGLTLVIDDITGAYTSLNLGGYGAPNPLITDITKVRFVFSTYLSETQASPVTDCLMGVEYIVGGTGTVVVDTKTFTTGQTFILQQDGTPSIATTATLTETGRFAGNCTFLPTLLNATFVPSDLNITGLVFQPDTTVTCTYEVYTGNIAAGAGNAAGTYIVQGTPITDTVIIGTSVYQVGEVINPTGIFTFSGSGTLCLLNAFVTEPFPIIYQTYQFYIAAMQEFVNGCSCSCGGKIKVCRLAAILEDVREQFENSFSVDYSLMQTLFDEATQISQNTCNC